MDTFFRLQNEVEQCEILLEKAFRALCDNCAEFFQLPDERSADDNVFILHGYEKARVRNEIAYDYLHDLQEAVKRIEKMINTERGKQNEQV